MPKSNKHKAYLISAILVTSALYAAYQRRQNSKWISDLHTVQRSPLRTILPRLAASDLSRLPYQPDQFPGARDVDTPYGNCRVYEFGPEDGPKVLLVHGISTPCLSLVPLAEEFVKRGARVMLFDLFGRGFSDNPSPTHFPHSSHLYIAQILCVLASSPIQGWTGQDNAFCIIGYSLGGGIASAFTDKFPRLVSALVLMAPSGLVRESHVAWQSKILYHTQGILPEWLVKRLVMRRLDVGGTGMIEAEGGLLDKDAQKQASSLKDKKEADSVGKKRLQVIDSACQWQLYNHPGFLDAFISAIRYAPITAQTATYARIGSRQSASLGPNAGDSLCGGKVTLVLGADDPIVIASEQSFDHKAALGVKGDAILRVILLEGVGHEVPVTVPALISEKLWTAWKEDGVPGMN